MPQKFLVVKLGTQIQILGRQKLGLGMKAEHFGLTELDHHQQLLTLINHKYEQYYNYKWWRPNKKQSC